MKIALFNHHTPYVSLLARALPEHAFYLLPTAHAPQGWREDQRPLPRNVRLVERSPHPALPDGPEARACSLWIAQTAHDVELTRSGGSHLPWRQRAAWSGPLAYLSHNIAGLEGPPSLGAWLAAQGIPLVTISALKKYSWEHDGYDRNITGIPPGIPPDDYTGEYAWKGGERRILTVCNNIRRSLFDLDAWLEATAGLPVDLVGEGNAGIPGAVGPAADFDHLRQLYASHRVYLSVNKWPHEDGYNLSLLEAMAAGMPCVALTNPTAPRFVSQQRGATLREALEYALEDHDGARHGLGDGLREVVKVEWSLETFAARWRRALEEVTHG